MLRCTISPWWHMAMTSSVMSVLGGKSIFLSAVTCSRTLLVVSCVSALMFARICADAILAGVGQLSCCTLGIRSVPCMFMSSGPMLVAGVACCGVMTAICGFMVCLFWLLLTLCFLHSAAVAVHPLRDRRSQKWFCIPGMCTVSNVNERR